MINVIEISQGVVHQNLLFIGENAVKNAEDAFRTLVRAQRDCTDEDMDSALDDGYFESNQLDWSVCLTHPEVKS
jgi:hypothetical protein